MQVTLTPEVWTMMELITTTAELSRLRRFGKAPNLRTQISTVHDAFSQTSRKTPRLWPRRETSEGPTPTLFTLAAGCLPKLIMTVP
jgi:hypothetical protein